MNDITVAMAIVYFIPVALFFAAALILQRDLYNKMVKGAFALLATGSIMVLVGGIYKALWKILFALKIADVPALSGAFFPLQGPGFLLVFFAFIGMFSKYNKKTATLNGVAIVPVFSSNLPFVGLQTLGCAGMQWCLFVIAKKMKKPLAMAMFVIAFVTMLGMGYLSAKFDDSSSMHWMAQTVNIVSTGALLCGVLIIHSAGLEKTDALKAEN